MIQKTAIIGMGALGTLYGGIITKALGRDSVEFIVDSDRYERYKKKSTSINGEPVNFKIVSADDATEAGLVIIAVKLGGLMSALDSIKKCVGNNTIILSVMNGISSEEIIAGRYGKDRVIYTVALGMSAMKLGDDLICKVPGKLHIGITDEKQRQLLDSVCEFFDRAKMPYEVEADILRRLWSKFMMNVGINQVAAAYGANNEMLIKNTEFYSTMVGAMKETIALANAEGIDLSDTDIEQAVAVIHKLDPLALPSTAQDIVAKRLTEVDMFAGTVIAMSKVHGLEAPINEDLYKRIKTLELQF